MWALPESAPPAGTSEMEMGEAGHWVLQGYSQIHIFTLDQSVPRLRLSALGPRDPRSLGSGCSAFKAWLARYVHFDLLHLWRH
jgi:hypothetical protein